MGKDSQEKPQISAEQMRSLLSSEEAKQLIALLQRDGGQRRRQAAQEFKKGNTAGAQELLRPVVETKEADELLKKINKKSR